MQGFMQIYFENYLWPENGTDANWPDDGWRCKMRTDAWTFSSSGSTGSLLLVFHGYICHITVDKCRYVNVCLKVLFGYPLSLVLVMFSNVTVAT